MNQRAEICTADGIILMRGELRHLIGDKAVIACFYRSELEKGMSVLVRILEEEGVREYSGIVKIVTHVQVTVGQMKFERFYDRRASFKVYASLNAMVTRLGRDENGGRIKLGNPVKAHVRDISLGGLFMTAAEELPVGFEVEILVEALDKSLTLTARILRSQPTRFSPYAYGCQFVEMPNSTEEVLCSVLFRLQKLQKGMVE